MIQSSTRPAGCSAGSRAAANSSTTTVRPGRVLSSTRSQSCSMMVKPMPRLAAVEKPGTSVALGSVLKSIPGPSSAIATCR